jgi:hypothetical protein
MFHPIPLGFNYGLLATLIAFFGEVPVWPAIMLVLLGVTLGLIYTWLRD